ncbi:hypothetical protein Tco_1236205 [Tanacetum coccineum]
MLEEPRGIEDAIVIPEITRIYFEIKHGLLNLVQNNQFFGHDKGRDPLPIRLFQQDHFYDEVPKRPDYSTPAVSSDVAELKDMVRAIDLDKKKTKLQL